MTKSEARKHAVLTKRADELEAELERLHEEAEAADGDADEDAISALEAQAEAAQEALRMFETALDSYDAEALSMAGAVVCVRHDGCIEVHRGLVRPQDRKAVARAAHSANSADDVEARASDPPARPQHSAALMLELTARRTLAARAAMLDQPRVALAALLHCLVQRVLYDGYGVPVTAVRLVTHAADAGVNSFASDGVKDSKAAQLLADARNRWGERVPGDQAKLLPWLVALGDRELQDLFSFCVAMTLNDVRDTDGAGPLDGLAAALSLDMADWWQPTADGYFSRVTKETILAAITEGAGPEAAARIKGVSKQELARVAERELEGRRWLPGPLHRALPSATGGLVALDMDAICLEVLGFEAKQVAAGHAGHQLEPHVGLNRQHAASLAPAVQRQTLDHFPVLDIAIARLLARQTHLALERVAIDVAPLDGLRERMRQHLDLTVCGDARLALRLLIGSVPGVAHVDVLVDVPWP